MLRSLSLLPVYDSSTYDLTRDLLVPLLHMSKEYVRGVGFFSSGWLRVASEGVSDFVRHGGTARIVLSPVLESGDLEALKLGSEARQDEVLRRALERNIEELERSLEEDTLNALAWMVADGVLDFRFALPRRGFEGGNYHDKVGVFTDEAGDMVAFHGSFNDSIQGTLNGEAFSVFKSWELGQRPYVDAHYRRLTSLWHGNNPQFNTHAIPEAVRDQLIRLRSRSARPYSLPEASLTRVVYSRDTPGRAVELRGYQEAALQAWLASNCQGLLEMATGVGKTYTALAAAVDRYQALGKLAVIIAVPYLHLLDQWQKDCVQFGFRPNHCSSAHGNWQLNVVSKVQDFSVGGVSALCLLVVHQTAASERFARTIKGLNPEYTMLIGDEVHSLGSHQLRNAMTPRARMRLGLSATPRRWLDPEGSQAITSYFGDICFEFPLGKAVEQGYLAPYEYLPVLASLGPDEMEDYASLSTRIGVLIGDGARLTDENEDLKRLLLKRARIVAGARAKIPKLLSILRDLIQQQGQSRSELKHVLIYCAPGTHSHVLNEVSNLGLRCHEFVHTVSAVERQEILSRFAEGDLQALVAVRCLDEGVDVPATQTAFLLASTSNPREFIQRRGRILRKAEGKNRATVYDFVVVPNSSMIQRRDEMGASLLRREMPRFSEFASAATNFFQARAQIRDILDKYQMLDLLDKKPWEIHAELQAHERDLVGEAE